MKMENNTLCSLDSERNVLGALMLSGNLWDDVSCIVSADDFVRHEHKLVFTALQRLAEASKPLEASLVSAKLAEFSDLEAAGGEKFLGELMKNCAGTYHAMHHAALIRDRAQLRRLTQTFKQSESVIEDPELSIAEKVSTISDRLETVLTGVRVSDEAMGAIEAGRSWVDSLHATFNAGTAITGVRTGFPQLDATIRGLNKKHMTVLAARPSMGKSTLATNVARNILSQGGSVFLATMEMSSDDVMHQMCAAHTGVSYEAIQQARLGDEAIGAAVGAFGACLRNWRLSIDHRGTQTVASIRRGVKRHIRKHGPCVVIVDYVQLLSDKGENETNRIGAISRGMKMLAQDLDIPVLLLSQLSRECEKRPDKRPMLSDLRGSGDIEQDASEVLFLYDDAVYNPDTTSAGFTELIVAKNRHGRRGIVIPLLKQLDRARFVSPGASDMNDNWRGLERRDDKTRRAAL